MNLSNNNQGGFNDLNHQLYSNLQSANQKRLPNAQIVTSNKLTGLRGQSRSSNTRGATQGHIGQIPHSGTSNSQKRQINGVNTKAQHNTLNLNLVQRRLGANQSKNLEYLPITTTSYTTTGKSNISTTREQVNKKCEFPKLSNAEQQPTSIRYSSLMANSDQQPLGSIGLNGLHLLNASKINNGKITGGSISNQRIVYGTNVGFENQSLQQLTKTGIQNQTKSKTMLQQQQPSRSIDLNANENQVIGHKKQLTNAEALNPITSELKSPKQLINNANMQLNKNTVASSMAEHGGHTRDYHGTNVLVLDDNSKLNPSGTNQDSILLPSVVVSNQTGYQPIHNASLSTLNNNNAGKPPIVDNIRKLAYAAKSGQMQLQNNPQEHLNAAFAQYNSQNNLAPQQINEPTIIGFLQSKNASMINQIGNPGGQNLNGIQNATKPQAKSFVAPGGCNVIIPPPSNLGIHKQQIEQQNDLDRDIYFQKRQIVQQQRLKKQELIKHIDHNNRILSQNVVNRYIHGNDQESTHQSNQNGQSTNEAQVAMANSGSQYLLGSNQAAQSQYSSNGEQALIVNNNFNPTLRSIPKTSQKEQPMNNGTNTSMGNHNESTNPIMIQRPGMIQVESNLGNPSDILFNQKRRMNMLSYQNDPSKSLPSSTVNAKQQKNKFRASELQQQYLHTLTMMSMGFDMKPNTSVVGGISGKQIALTTTNHANTHLPNLQSQTFQNQPNMQIGATSDQMINHIKQHNQTPNVITMSGQITQRYEQVLSNTTGQSINDKSNINCKITRKLEGGRPHKVYDYMFIQMSNEQFKSEYDNKKIFIQKSQHQFEQEQDTERRKQFQTQVIPNKFKLVNEQNLDGLVKIKAYDNIITDELPLMQCNLLPTQLDHVKLLICEQEDKNYPKLTPEAAARFEIEKQNQIKQYMEDIILKLQQKQRKFKVTVKKKFIEDALYNSTSIRVASVYVIVVNREKAYDPISSKQFLQKHKKLINDVKNEETSEDDVVDYVTKIDVQKLRENLRRSVINPNFINLKKTSMYESDNNVTNIQDAHNDNTKALLNYKQFLLEKTQDERTSFKNKIKPVAAVVPTTVKSKVKTEDQQFYRYITPIKEFPSKYKETKIKICQDASVNDHYKKHPINVYTNQYNEFIRLIFKNQKQHNNQKFNIQYAFGLARALGLNLKKDTFTEQNMKSREHICMSKEKLIYCFWKKLHEENKEVQTIHDKNQHQLIKTINDQSENELDGGNSIDSTIASNNTPRSKSLGMTLKQETEVGSVTANQQKQPNTILNDINQWALPQNNVIYKYIIGKGNNSLMVRGLFKNRYWWVQGDESDNKIINFTWTQNKVQKIFDNMACKYPNRKSGNKTNEFSQLHATPQQTRSVKKKKLQNSENHKKDAPAAAGIKHSEIKIYNKIEDNYHLNNKKALYVNMKNYYEAIGQDVFDNLPLTFHIKTGFDDPEFKRFEQSYKKFEEEIKMKKKKREQQRAEKSLSLEAIAEQQVTLPVSSPDKQADNQANVQAAGGAQKTTDQPSSETQKEQSKPNYYKTQQPQKNIWIIKPGENTNQGKGIQVAKEIDEIKDIIADSTRNSKRTCILQKYIHNPLLINRRKFDIRTYALFTSMNGNLKAYVYEEGYLRTSCREYSIQNLSNKLVHLTNDAVQKTCQDYGKYEPGNKLSFNEFQSFLDKSYPDLNICFERDLLPQIYKMTTDIFRACHGKLDPKRRLNCMEVFGLDFMIDDEFRLYLIEVNTNPCLELSSPLLARLIPNMLENALKVGMDPNFLPTEGFSQKKAYIGDPCPENRYTLVYDNKVDGPVLDKLLQNKRDVIVEMDEEFSDDEDVHDEAEDD